VNRVARIRLLYGPERLPKGLESPPCDVVWDELLDCEMSLRDAFDVALKRMVWWLPL